MKEERGGGKQGGGWGDIIIENVSVTITSLVYTTHSLLQSGSLMQISSRQINPSLTTITTKEAGGEEEAGARAGARARVETQPSNN